ncbi:hypothetical protein CLOP_g11863 [Closterium sp. NIES-67]|nr:hypothetical protein CLOP_g11863 [Closterium sp. NIES-67]
MAGSHEPAHVLHELTEAGDLDLLSAIFARLPFKTLLAASQVCCLWSQASEHLFQRECERKGWKPPRRPRGQTELSSFRPWRSLFFRHACRCCGAHGEFIVRHAKPPPPGPASSDPATPSVSASKHSDSAHHHPTAAAADKPSSTKLRAPQKLQNPQKKLLVSNPHASRDLWFLLCLQCTRLPGVQLRLVRLNACVDTVGITGSRLGCREQDRSVKRKRKQERSGRRRGDQAEYTA